MSTALRDGKGTAGVLYLSSPSTVPGMPSTMPRGASHGSSSPLASELVPIMPDIMLVALSSQRCSLRALLILTCLYPGQEAGTGVHVLPQSYWYELLYGTVLLALCLLVCLVGASIYAKATFLIFLIVAAVLGTILVSFFATRPLKVPIHLPSSNGTETDNGFFTGFSLNTLRDNLGGEEKLLPPCLLCPGALPHHMGLARGWGQLVGTKQVLCGGFSCSLCVGTWR